MKQEPISCRADNALAARCQSFAARWACVLKRPIFYLAACIDNNNNNNEWYIQEVAWFELYGFLYTFHEKLKVNIFNFLNNIFNF